MERIVSVFTAIIGLAGVAVVIQSPNTSKIIKETGAAFTSAIKGATGR